MNKLFYRISSSAPQSHRFQVEVRVPAAACGSSELVLHLAAWTPGSYKVRDFARHLHGLTATQNEGNLVLRQRNKQCWAVSGMDRDSEVLLRYEILARDDSIRAAFLDDEYGFIDGACFFLRIAGTEDWPVEVEVERPHGFDWSLATTMPVVSVSESGFGRFSAENYRSLIDYPMLMGELDIIAFEAGGVPHSMVLQGAGRFDSARLAQDLANICQAQIDYFEEPSCHPAAAPFSQYQFLCQVRENGYGGLEHCDSTALICSRKDLPLPRSPLEKTASAEEENGPVPINEGVSGLDASEDYLRFLGLCSHEYLHCWNVKRIQPIAVAGSDLSSESHFSDLWAWEGVTSYLDDLGLLRASVISAEQWLGMVAEHLNRLWKVPGRAYCSLADSSFNAWTGLYQADVDTPNSLVSYYTKGAVVALLLDLEIRSQSAQTESLQSMMQRLWKNWQTDQRPQPEHALQTMIVEKVGPSIQAFFDEFIYAANEPDYAAALATFGIHARCGVEKAAPTAQFRFAAGKQQTEVALVERSGAAEAAGLASGDQVIALEGMKTHSDCLVEQLSAYQPGEVVELTGFRRGRLRNWSIELVDTPPNHWRLSLMKDPSAEVLARRQQWIGQ